MAKSEKLQRRLEELNQREKELIQETKNLESRLTDAQTEGTSDVKPIVRSLAEARIELESIPNARRKTLEALRDARLAEEEESFRAKEKELQKKLDAIRAELERLGGVVKASEERISSLCEGIAFASRGIDHFLGLSNHLSTGWTQIFEVLKSGALQYLRTQHDARTRLIHEEISMLMGSIRG